MMTDDLSMGAPARPDRAARGARRDAAGCDLILHCNGERDENGGRRWQRPAVLDGAALTRTEGRHWPGAAPPTRLTSSGPRPTLPTFWTERLYG